jgi:hypothetical protein
MRALRQTLVVAFLAAGMLWAQNVGIGTATPQTRLHVHGAGGVTGGIRVTSTGTGGPTVNFYAGTATPDAGHISFGDNTGWKFHITRASDGANLVTIQDNGNVGIGTTAPVNLLHVSAPSGSQQGIYWRDGNNADLRIYRDTDVGDWSLLRSDIGNGIAIIGQPDHVALCVSRTTSNVGIWTTAPAERLHVQGNIRFSGALMPGGNAGTTGQVLVSQGAGNAPQWQNPSALTGFYKLLFVDAWNPSVNSNLGWSCSGCDDGSPYLTTCGSVRMLGGYGMCGSGCYFEKTFTGLPAHTEVMVEVFWWSVDSWDQHSGSVDLVALSIDGTEVSRATPYGPITSNVNTRSTNASVCGVSGWVDAGPQILVGWRAHTAPSVTVRVTNLANGGSTDESMGIVMVRVWVK